ncbi:MAG: peptidylprolyl isomerase [Candidatus Omnitrophica bacterium]|nr:peptidylprolyl isomerase [Candidatus Omnitrophota bacterium]
MDKRLIIIFLFSLSLLNLFNGTAYGEDSSSKVIGEAFGRPISLEEFNYYYKTAALFTRLGPKEGGETRTEEEIRQEAWQNLIYRQESARLNITVSREELLEELKRLVSEKDIEYGTDNYKIWVTMQLGEGVDSFERRIEDLLIINKYMKLKTEPEVTVTEEEMKQKFLNQYNSFESEYIRFETEEEAKEFAEKVKKNPRLWYDTYIEKKEIGQKGASWINIMSLEALIDLWKIPKDDAYRILSYEKGDFIVAEFFYGVAVFRLLNKRDADIEKYTEQKQKYYRDMLTTVKKRKIIKDYFEDLLERARFRDYVAEEMRAKKIEELKMKTLVAIKTNHGIVVLKLFPDIAPMACENFIGLVEKGYYEGIIFHRVIKDFMIQTGDPTGTGTGGESIWGEPFQDEVSEEVKFDKPGILAMANSGPNTNKSQFFITTNQTPWLNKKHTIFGEVVSGYDVVEKIQGVETDSKDKPKEEQQIIKAYVKKGQQKSDDNIKEETDND